MFSVPSQPGENRGERLGEFESRSVKTRDAVLGFHLLENSHKLCRGFQQTMEARKTCFISFIKLLFSLLTKRKTMYEALTVNSHNSETVKPYCSRHFCASQRYENTLVDQSKRTLNALIQIIVVYLSFQNHIKSFTALQTDKFQSET